MVHSQPALHLGDRSPSSGGPACTVIQATSRRVRGAPSLGCNPIRAGAHVKRDAGAVPVASRVELTEVLVTGGFERLIDTPESEWFECKGLPPDVGSARGLRDFIADVASFANAQGGTLVYGLMSKIDQAARQELVAEVVGVDWAKINVDQLLKLVRAHIRPLLHLEIRRYDNDSQCLLVVVVDAQSDGPFLVDRVGTEADEKNVKMAFGWPVRHGDGTHWESLDRVQQLISTGLRLSSALQSTAPEAGLREESIAQVELIAGLEEFCDWAFYTVQAIPTTSTRIAGFFGEFIETARQWHGVRENGFDLGFRWDPLEPSSQQRSLSQGGRRAVVVSRRGVLTAGAVGSPDMLGWANHQNIPWESLPFVEINPFAIVEYTAEFVRFAYEVIGPRLETPSGWRLVARGHHIKGSDARKPLYLRERPRRALSGWGTDPKPPIDGDFEVYIDGTGDALADAYRLLGEAFENGWAVPAENVPFALDGRIDFGTMATT